jgi:hypothetical protein
MVSSFEHFFFRGIFTFWKGYADSRLADVTATHKKENTE